MKVLVIGNGGREHTLIWKLNQSPKVSKLFCAPGNGGTSGLAESVHIDVDDIQQIADFAQSAGIDLTVVGPEAPLVAGIVDEFNKRGMRIFGPTKAAARLEGSKVFAKELMAKYKIPTASFEVARSPQEAKSALQRFGLPVVIKADGLAAGKGVIIAKTKQEAEGAIDLIMIEKEFGTAGDMILIEECLTGEEVSILAFTDGHTVIPMVSAQDHKRVFDGDQGPNTGGMGAYSPAPIYTESLSKQVEDQILLATIQALKNEGISYSGVLYAGLMLTESGPKVLEYNARFGDPETQVILPRLMTDLMDILLDATSGTLDRCHVTWNENPSVCVVMASGGYPGKYQIKKEIFGLENVPTMKQIMIFHAGTTAEDDRILTSGGRVLGVTAIGETLQAAIDRAYQTVRTIHFDGAHYRNDIGYKALK